MITPGTGNLRSAVCAMLKIPNQNSKLQVITRFEVIWKLEVGSSCVPTGTHVVHTSYMFDVCMCVHTCNSTVIYTIFHYVHVHTTCMSCTPCTHEQVHIHT